jgi:hypothetical protein
MKTLKLGDTLEFAEHDGIYKKKIVNIIWKEGGKKMKFFCLPLNGLCFFLMIIPMLTGTNYQPQF